MTDVISDHASRYARSRRHYIVACVVLLLLLATSAALGRVHMGIGNLIAGVGIAVVKAAIVAWIFMSLREATPLTRIVAAAGVVALLLLGSLSLIDFIPRHDEPTTWQQPQWVPPALDQPHRPLPSSTLPTAPPTAHPP